MFFYPFILQPRNAPTLDCACTTNVLNFSPKENRLNNRYVFVFTRLRDNKLWHFFSLQFQRLSGTLIQRLCVSENNPSFAHEHVMCTWP